MVEIICQQVLLVIRDRTPTLGTLALLGVPGCWARMIVGVVPEGILK